MRLILSMAFLSLTIACATTVAQPTTAATRPSEPVVWVTPHGLAYHLELCQFTSHQAQPISLSAAKRAGKHRCNVCVSPE